jgi:rhamnosyltransferase
MSRLVLFAHYDPDGEVKPFVLRHLEGLRELGGRIELLSNSPVPPAEAERLGPRVDRLLVRENVGYDFGMWRDALAGRDLAGVDELVLVNGSVVGPLSPLAPIFGRMEAWDFWGMTESWQHGHHLQSWFLVLRRPVLASEAFRRFFAGVLDYRAKDPVIYSYEVGLSTWLWENGFKGAAAFPASSLPSAWLADLLVRHTRPWVYRTRKNPTVYYADRLLAAGMPYLKVELFRRHPRLVRAFGLERALAGRDLRGLVRRASP